MLFGGRPPGAYGPDDIESDFDEMIDDDIEWWVLKEGRGRGDDDADGMKE
jgi:hypothetical protein